MLTPKEIAEKFITTGIKKAGLPAGKALLLGIFAGVFIALAGAGSAVASATVQDPSMGRFLNALIFPAGLVMVLLAGSELFTGNSLMIIPVLEKEVKLSAVLKNWMLVYIGNLIGSLLVAAMIVYSHVPDLFGGRLAECLVNCAAAKESLSFGDAFLRGILCNILVCIAVWVAAASESAHGKVVALYLPIVVFVLCGFEHCVANMFSIPAGLFSAMEYEIAAEGLGWPGFFITNLIPVTLGNMAGGCLVGGGYWLCYLKDRKKQA